MKKTLVCSLLLYVIFAISSFASENKTAKTLQPFSGNLDETLTVG